MSAVNVPPSPIPPWLRSVSSALTQTLAEAGAIDLNCDVTYLDAAETALDQPIVCTLAAGNYTRQIKRIYVLGTRISAGSATFSVTGTFAGFTSLTFDAVGFNAVLEWDGGAWQMIGGNATTN